MTWWSDQLDTLVRLADAPGEELPPTALLKAAGALGTPLAAIVTLDGAAPLFAALDQDLGTVWPIRHAKDNLTDHQTQQLVASLRWLITGLVSWHKANDVNGVQISSLLLVAARFDEDGALWQVLPDRIGENPDLGPGLVHVLSHLKINLDMGFTHSPISDGETLAAIQKAEADRNWSRLRQVAEGLCYVQMTPVFVSQAARALQRFFLDDLVGYVRTISQIAMAMQVATALSVEAAIDVAFRAGAELFQFAAVCRLFNQYTRVPSLTPAQEDRLVNLLTEIAKSSAQWDAWMTAFAAHPYRSSQMQSAIGRAMAVSNPSAAAAYIAALVLQASFVGRDEVAACLLAFAQHAPLERRQAVWRQAFERWSAWRFGEADSHGALDEVCLSNLDFAIVGYSVECITPAERTAFIEGCIDAVGRSEHRWHASQTAFGQFIYTNLSLLIPFAYGQDATADPATWLWAKDRLVLVPALNEAYWRLRYHLRKYAQIAAQEAAKHAVSSGPS